MRASISYRDYLEKIFCLVGKKGMILFGAGILSSFVLSGIEYAIAVFLMVFLFSLGLIDHFQLPSWLPFDFRTASPLSVWMLLFLIGVIQAVSKIVTYQSKIMLTEKTHARMRMVLGYKLLKSRRNPYMALSSVNLYMTEYFPKATSFIFHGTQLVSFFILALMIGLGLFYFARGPALVGVLGLAAMGGIVFQLNRITNRISRRVPEVQADLEKTKVRVIRNWLLIRILRVEEREYRNYMNSVFHYYRHSALAFLYGNLGGALIPVLGIVVIALMVLSNQYLFHHPTVDLIAFLYLFFRFQQMVANGSNLIGGLFTYRVQMRESFQLIFSLPREELRRALAPDAAFKLSRSRLHHAENPRGSLPPAISRQRRRILPPRIDVRNVSFAWPGAAEPLFKDLSLQIANGGHLGIIGPNGSGKSTFLALLLGVLAPDSGEVLMDGASCHTYIDRNCHAIGLVGTEPYLIHGSILENMTYGMGRAYSEKDVFRALQTVRLDRFVKELPGGLDYPLQENGDGLSSGQKQRLTIARAFFRRPSLLILDEPTANLDAFSESLISEAIHGLKGRCTVILVSHNPDILRSMDAIFEMGRQHDRT